MVELVDVYETPGAVEILWRLMMERSGESVGYINISHKRMPTRKEHLSYFESRPYHRWLFIKRTGILVGLYSSAYAGVVNITKRNEIGIVLFQSQRGKGLGGVALATLLATENPLPAIPGERTGYFLANINPENTRSIALFEGLGFKHVQNTYALCG